MENLILFQVNALGAVLGYPFHVYSDGTCGKKLVSDSGKANSVIVVKKPFAVNSLQSDYLTGSAGEVDEIFAHLAEVAEKMVIHFMSMRMELAEKKRNLRLLTSRLCFV